MPVTVQAIREAREMLRGVARLTPVAPAPYLTQRVGGPVWLKCENLQHTGSFKARGALNKVMSLSRAEIDAVERALHRVIEIFR